MPKDNVRVDEDSAVVDVDPRFFSLDTVFSAAYAMLDRAYFVFDGDPKKSIQVIIRSKDRQGHEKKGREKKTPEALAREFNDELINFSVYERQLKAKGQLREEMLKRALLTNLAQEDDYKEDKEQILVPWEEKYGT